MTTPSRHPRLDAANRLRTSRFGVILFFGYLVAVVALAPISVIAFQRSANAAETAKAVAERSQAAICSLQAERQRRYRATLAILKRPKTKENARIIKALGKPVLVRGLASAKSDLDALRSAEC